MASSAALHRARPALGYTQVLAGAALFGLAAIVSKMSLTAGIAPARLSALRCTGAALGLLLFLGMTQPSRLRVPNNATCLTASDGDRPAASCPFTALARTRLRLCASPSASR